MFKGELSSWPCTAATLATAVEFTGVCGVTSHTVKHSSYFSTAVCQTVRLCLSCTIIQTFISVWFHHVFLYTGPAGYGSVPLGWSYMHACVGVRVVHVCALVCVCVCVLYVCVCTCMCGTCVCTCMCGTCVCTCMCGTVCALVCVVRVCVWYVCVHLYVCMCVCVCARVIVYVSACDEHAFACVCGHMCMCMCVCVSVCILPQQSAIHSQPSPIPNCRIAHV